MRGVGDGAAEDVEAEAGAEDDVMDTVEEEDVILEGIYPHRIVLLSACSKR